MGMRDIRFRGKRLDTGEWVTGWYLEAINYLSGETKPQIGWIRQAPSAIDRNIPAFEPIANDVDPATVGQYTGLECDNGSVYEGDIIWWGDMQPFGYVFFDDGAFRVTDPDSDTSELLIDVMMGAKIIGNIHENPELLEVAP